MSATPLTDARWSGLPLLQCNMDPGLYQIDVETPMLVIRDDPGTHVEVFNDGGRDIVFNQAPLRFDLFPRGLVMNARSDRVATKSLVVALPTDWLDAQAAAPESPVRLRAHYQFADPPLRRLVWRLTTHFRGGEPLGHAYSGAVSRTIVDRVLRLQFARDARHPDSAGLSGDARRTLDTVIDRRLQEPPTASELAALLGMGIERFHREFKLTLQATPHQYIQGRRLLRACEMLRTTDASLTTVALDTGFASHSHFSTVFRAATGVTPRQYRQTV
ncbi:MAG: AraC family transcriptional regulator [Pseudomonadota bacterium]|nr:AraC family transcriptional regulator [Pseudomonadota bacterium]